MGNRDERQAKIQAVFSKAASSVVGKLTKDLKPDQILFCIDGDFVEVTARFNNERPDILVRFAIAKDQHVLMVAPPPVLGIGNLSDDAIVANIAEAIAYTVRKEIGA